MQVRCYSCHTPFAMNREAVFAALDQITAEGHSHFNAFCPRCRKANRLSRQQLLRGAPGWIPPEERGEPADEAKESEGEG